MATDTLQKEPNVTTEGGTTEAQGNGQANKGQAGNGQVQNGQANSGQAKSEGGSDAKSQNGGTGTQAMTKSQPSYLQRRDTSWGDPLATMQRLQSEMDAIFESFGFGRSPLFGRRRSGLLPAVPTTLKTWSPQIELEERDGNIVVRADLPGLNKEDVRLEVEDDVLTIEGERKDTREEKREGYYHSERSYGSFRRSIPLPEGVDPEQVKANFRNGVLEVTMPAPQPQQAKSRQIQVED